MDQAIIILKTALTVCSIIAGAASAICWGISTKNVSAENAVVVVKYDSESYDLLKTLRHQSTWNRRGAIAAAIAISLQALSQIF